MRPRAPPNRQVCQGGTSRFNAIFRDLQPIKTQPHPCQNQSSTTPKRPVAADSLALSLPKGHLSLLTRPVGSFRYFPCHPLTLSPRHLVSPSRWHILILSPLPDTPGQAKRRPGSAPRCPGNGQDPLSALRLPRRVRS